MKYSIHRFKFAIFSNSLQKGYLPREELNHPYAAQHLLEQLGTLIRPGYALDPDREESFHHHCVYWCSNNQKSKPRQCARAKVDEQQDETDDELDKYGPGHVKIP